MRYFVTLLLASVLLISCQRDHLYYAASNTATIHLNIDWSNSDMIPNGLTVFAYNQNDGSLYKQFDPISTPESAYINLPIGIYTLVLMSDTPEEYSGSVEFKGVGNISTLKVVGIRDEERTKKMTESVSTKVDDEYCILEPDQLAIDIIKGVEVTPEMVDYFYEKPASYINEKSPLEISAEPHAVISKLNIKVHVKGLNYAKGTTLSFLNGVSSGYYLGKDMPAETRASHAFILNNRTFDQGSYSDGIISASFNTFGLLDESKDNLAECQLVINFVLVNGTSYPVTFDVTDKIEMDKELTLVLNLNLDLELPEAVGDDTEDGAFSTDLNEWVDIIQEITV